MINLMLQYTFYRRIGTCHKRKFIYNQNRSAALRFAADVRIGEQRTTLEVNHPHSYRLGEDIYLTGYDTRNVGNTRYCILQIVRQPWKYVMVTGILMMLAGAVLLFINGPKKAKS